MDIVVDILLAGILLLYFFRGWDNGLMYAVVNVLGVVGSYVLATVASPFLTSVLSEKYSLAMVIAYILSWTSIFLIIVLIFWVLKRTALKNITYHIRTEEDYHLPLYSKAIGGVVSLILGIIVLTIGIFLYGTMSGGIRNSSLPDISGSTIVDASSLLSRKLAYTGIKKTTGNPVIARKFAVALSRPHRTMLNIRRTAASKAFRNLISDKDFIDAIIEKREVDISNSPALIALLQDAKTMKALCQLGIVEKAVYTDLDFRYALSHKLVTLKFDKVAVKKRITALRNRNLLEKKNVDKLLKDRRFHELIDELFFRDMVELEGK